MSEEPAEEEIIDFIRSAKERVRVFREGQNKIRIDVDDQTRRIPYNEELFKKLQAVAAEVKETIRSRGRTSVAGTSDTALFSTQVRGKRPLVEQLMEKLTWLQGAMLDVGAETFVAVLMASGENPDRIPEIIQGFNDREKFVNYVLDKLYNFISAAKSQQEALSLREQLVERDLKIAVLEDKLEEMSVAVSMMSTRLERLKRMYEMALSIMDVEQLDKHTRMLQILGIIEGGEMPQPGMPEQEVTMGGEHE
jgi:predicted RNase H-like nuclease (RuvC/YqgF family)